MSERIVRRIHMVFDIARMLAWQILPQRAAQRCVDELNATADA